MKLLPCSPKYRVGSARIGPIIVFIRSSAPLSQRAAASAYLLSVTPLSAIEQEDPGAYQGSDPQSAPPVCPTAPPGGDRVGQTEKLAQGRARLQTKHVGSGDLQEDVWESG
jgi:hypothetical protein